MFNFIFKRRGPTLVNAVKRHVVKRRINSNSLSKSLPRRDNMVKNFNKQYWIKLMSMNDVDDRKYSSLAEPIEERKLRHMFTPLEDSFAHSQLQNKEIYRENLVKNMPNYDDDITKSEIDHYINQSWKALPIQDFLEAFKRISYYASKNDECITDIKYERFIKYLITNCTQFMDTEICDVLLSLSIWPNLHDRKDPIFKALYLALDKECVRRAPQWTIDKLLLISDHWYQTRLYRYTEFASYVIKKAGSRPSRMTPSNLVQFMFYVNSARIRPMEMYNLEYKMESCVDELDLNELAIMAMGFFKSQTPIRNPNLLIKIIHRVIQDIDTIHEIALSAFLKITRYSTSMQNEHVLLWELLVSTLPQIPRLALQALVHIVTTAVRMRVFHPELLTAVAQRFSQEIQDARVKDMERLVLALTCFNFTPDIQPNIFETIVEELRMADRRPDLERYQKSLANLLQYLGVVNLYPKDLIAFVLDPENLKKTYGVTAFDLNQVILSIDLNIDIEVPDYTGPRLSSRERSITAKGNVNKIPLSKDRGVSARHRLVLEIVDTCKALFGSSEVVHLDWVLPQYKEADILICLDENNSPLPVKSLLSVIPFGEAKRRPEVYPEGCRWFALVIGAQNCYVRNTTQLLGKDVAKTRQLKKIGYTPIVIPWHEWCTSDRDKRNYLKEKLYK